LKQIRDKEYDDVMQFLVRNAPELELRGANKFAEKQASQAYELVEANRALAILAETRLGLDPNGHVDMTGLRASIRWALKRVQHIHASWVCSPFSGGLESLHAQVEKEFEKELKE
jgi:uncharacterized membrane-anchored protein